MTPNYILTSAAAFSMHHIGSIHQEHEWQVRISPIQTAVKIEKM